MVCTAPHALRAHHDTWIYSWERNGPEYIMFICTLSPFHPLLQSLSLSLSLSLSSLSLYLSIYLSISLSLSLSLSLFPLKQSLRHNALIVPVRSQVYISARTHQQSEILDAACRTLNMPNPSQPKHGNGSRIPYYTNHLLRWIQGGESLFSMISYPTIWNDCFVLDLLTTQQTRMKMSVWLLVYFRPVLE